MWRSKKFILIAALVALVLVGSIAGVTLAQTGSTDNATSGKTLLGRAAAILGIDQQKVKDAFSQAQREMREEALDSYLQNLVDQGKITQEQADQYKNWWQSKPQTPIPGPLGRFGRFGFCPSGGMRGSGQTQSTPTTPAA